MKEKLLENIEKYNKKIDNLEAKISYNNDCIKRTVLKLKEFDKFGILEDKKQLYLYLIEYIFILISLITVISIFPSTVFTFVFIIFLSKYFMNEDNYIKVLSFIALPYLILDENVLNIRESHLNKNLKNNINKCNELNEELEYINNLETIKEEKKLLDNILEQRFQILFYKIRKIDDELVRTNYMKILQLYLDYSRSCDIDLDNNDNQDYDLDNYLININSFIINNSYSLEERVESIILNQNKSNNNYSDLDIEEELIKEEGMSLRLKKN